MASAGYTVRDVKWPASDLRRLAGFGARDDGPGLLESTVLLLIGHHAVVGAVRGRRRDEPPFYAVARSGPAIRRQASEDTVITSDRTDRSVRELTRASLACGVSFFLLAVLVGSGWSRLAALDEQGLARAYAFTLGHGWCEELARAATFLGNGWTVTALTAVVAVGCASTGRWGLAWWLVVTVAGSAVTGTVVKESMQRLRPDSAGILTSAQGFAFPSGHTRSATMTYVAVVLVVGWQVLHPARRTRVVSAAAVTAVVGSVGLSRIFLGAHWPSDVLGGWLLGSAWVTAATVVLMKMPGPGRPPPGR